MRAYRLKIISHYVAMPTAPPYCWVISFCTSEGDVFAMRALVGIIIGLLAIVSVTDSAAASVRVHVDVNSQTMAVYVNGMHRYTWHVSTGRRGYSTPGGSFRGTRMERQWYSRKYDMAPMPHAVFFKGGYAIHGTSEVKSLGRRASHGCVRLAPGNAAHLFNLVSRHGLANTRISIRN